MQLMEGVCPATPTVISALERPMTNAVSAQLDPTSSINQLSVEPSAPQASTHRLQQGNVCLVIVNA